MSEVQTDHVVEEKRRLPEGWQPDAATLEWVAQIVYHEIDRRGLAHQRGVIGKGSDRAENLGAILVLKQLVDGLLTFRDQLLNGNFGQPEKETDESRIVLP